MAKVIQFYVPARHHEVRRWTPEDQRGKVLAFPEPRRVTSVWLADATLWPLESWMPATAMAAKRRSPKPPARKSRVDSIW